MVESLDCLVNASGAPDGSPSGSLAETEPVPLEELAGLRSTQPTAYILFSSTMMGTERFTVPVRRHPSARRLRLAEGPGARYIVVILWEV